MGSTTKNDKSEMGQIMWDGPKWKTETNYPEQEGGSTIILIYF